MEKYTKGNGRKGQTPEEMANSYIEEYKEFIFKQQEASIERISGEDVKKTVTSQKETAGGMDQWMPAEFKLLSKKACGALAEMFNCIEEGASWPEQTTKARAAFLAKEEEWKRWREDIEDYVDAVTPGMKT